VERTVFVRGGVKFSKLTIHDKISALSEIYLPKNFSFRRRQKHSIPLCKVERGIITLATAPLHCTQSLFILVVLSHQDGRHSAVALLLKAALIQVSDYRLMGAFGFIIKT
jgi:hypothetical protein